MKRVGAILSLCLVAAACGEPPSAPVAPAKPAAKAEAYAVPPEERPVLGKIGDTTCSLKETEELLGVLPVGCLTLLKDTIKHDTAAGDADVRLARVRGTFFQPGPMENGKPVGWSLYATRINCLSQKVEMMGNVTYGPQGVEISRATPIGGPLPLPVGLSIAKLIAGVCPT